MPERSRRKMPFRTRRSSKRGTPFGLFGNSGMITRQPKSVSLYLPIGSRIERHRAASPVYRSQANPRMPVSASVRLILVLEWTRSIIVLRSATARPNHESGSSAPDKKSFTSVNSTILACSVFTSIAGATGSVRTSDPKTPAAPSNSCDRQVVIWFG